MSSIAYIVTFGTTVSVRFAHADAGSHLIGLVDHLIKACVAMETEGNVYIARFVQTVHQRTCRCHHSGETTHHSIHSNWQP